MTSVFFWILLGATLDRLWHWFNVTWVGNRTIRRAIADHWRER
jgi:hypothetical protein